MPSALLGRCRFCVLPGDELSIAYGLTIDEAITPELVADYSCHCATKRCTGSILALASHDRRVVTDAIRYSLETDQRGDIHEMTRRAQLAAVQMRRHPGRAVTPRRRRSQFTSQRWPPHSRNCAAFSHCSALRPVSTLRHHRSSFQSGNAGSVIEEPRPLTSVANRDSPW